MSEHHKKNTVTKDNTALTVIIDNAKSIGPIKFSRTLPVASRAGREGKRNVRIFSCCFSWELCLEVITSLIIYVSDLCMAQV